MPPPREICIIYDVPGWAYHHQAVAMEKFAPRGFELTLRASQQIAVEEILHEAPPDLIFCHPVKKALEIRGYLDRRGWRSRLVGYWSLGWPNKISRFEKLHDNVDLLICSNMDYANRIGAHERMVQISNGVDLTVFRTLVPIEHRRDKIIWIGSEYHRRIKSYDSVILPLFKELDDRGVGCQAMLVDSLGPNKLSQQEMVDWYNTATVLVCASESEGTPQPVLEAAACGCAVVSTAVGIVPELIRHGSNGYIVERRVDSLLEAVQRAGRERHRIVRQMARDIQSWHWENRVHRYFDEFEKILDVDR